MTTLEDDGYVVIADVVDERRLTLLRDAFERVVGDASSGTRHADHLHERDAVFAEVLENAVVNDAVRAVLGRPFRLHAFGARDPLPGFGQQGLHTDWLSRAPKDPYMVVTALWLLDDFTESNGATRVIPGSHHWPKPLPKEMQQPLARHRDERIVTADAGSVLVFNGHLWHSGTRNASQRSRRVLQVQWIGA